MLVAADFLMFFAERFRLHAVIRRVVLASVLWGLENVLQKFVFNHTGFVSGFVFITLGTFGGSLLLLARHSWRTQIFTNSEQATARTGAWYFLNRFLAGLGSFLIFYAISLTHPAMVDAIGGVRYAIVFLGAFVLTRIRPDILKDRFAGWVLLGKSVATGLVAVGLVLLALT